MLQAFQDDMLLARQGDFAPKRGAYGALRWLEQKEEGKSCRSWSCQSHIPPVIHTISSDPKPNSHQTHLRATPRGESAREFSHDRTFTGGPRKTLICDLMHRYSKQKVTVWGSASEFLKASDLRIPSALWREWRWWRRRSSVPLPEPKSTTGDHHIVVK